MTHRNDHDSVTWLIFILLLVSTLGASIRAQEITYNLTPTHELGEQLWQIPISGKLTMSADGKRVLVACLADSAFHMVDVETGAYRKLHSQYFQDNTYGRTQYGTDDQCRWLVMHGTDLRDGVARMVFRVEDTQTGEVVLEQEAGSTIRAVSQKQDRMMANWQLIKLSTFELIRQYPEEIDGFGAWFDDDRGLTYRARSRELQEINTTTGDVLRTWKVRATRFNMRRPSNSDWMYVFSTETDGLKDGSQNLVEAINLVTGERLTFEKYFWTLADGRPDFYDQPQCFTSSSTTCFAIGDDNTPHYSAIWEFDAEGATSNVITDLRFFYYDRYTGKTQAITPNKSHLLHCWYTADQDSSSILRCNALVPVATSAHEGSDMSNSTDVRVSQLDNTLTIELVGTTAEELITNVRIFTANGNEIASVPVSDPSVPVTVPIGHLSSGAYRCVVTTTGRELFASFTIVR